MTRALRYVLATPLYILFGAVVLAALPLAAAAVLIFKGLES